MLASTTTQSSNLSVTNAIYSAPVISQDDTAIPSGGTLPPPVPLPLNSQGEIISPNQDSKLNGTSTSRGGSSLIKAPDKGKPEGAKPSRSVRFYNRVRITSGIGHGHRQKSPSKDRHSHSHLTDNPVDSNQTNASTGSRTDNSGETQRFRLSPSPPVDIPLPLSTGTADSSASNSYSSSISAPLRPSSDLPPNLGYGRRLPISNVLDTTETNEWLRWVETERRERRKKRKRDLPTNDTEEINERTALLRGRERRERETSEEEEAAERRRHISWPWRAFSLYVRRPFSSRLFGDANVFRSIGNPSSQDYVVVKRWRVSSPCTASFFPRASYYDSSFCHLLSVSQYTPVSPCMYVYIQTIYALHIRFFLRVTPQLLQEALWSEY